MAGLYCFYICGKTGDNQLHFRSTSARLHVNSKYTTHHHKKVFRVRKRYPKRRIAQPRDCPTTGLGNQAQPVSVLVVSAMIAVRWLEANAGTSEQEMDIPTPKQLNSVNFNNELDFFKTTCKFPKIPKAFEMVWMRQRLMTWFRAVMTS